MLRLDDKIIQILSTGAKRYTDLKNEIVETGICANQTLVNHLKILEDEGKILKDILKNRSTVYSINSKYARKVSDIVEISKLSSLLDGLETRVIEDDFQIIEFEQKFTATLYDLVLSASNISKNKPTIKYSFYSDKSSLERLKLFTNFEEIASSLQNEIKKEFRQFYQTIPPLMEDFPQDETFSQWDSSIRYADQLGQKHNFRFLLYSYFDGTSYYERIQKAMKSLSNLRKGNEEWIFFLDEVGLRTSWANTAYHSDYNVMEEIFTNILDKVPTSSLAELCFIAEYGWIDQSYEIPSLESALVSDIIHKKYEDLKLVTKIGDDEVPFNLIQIEDFTKIKYLILTNKEKMQILEEILFWVQALLEKDGFENLQEYNPLFQLSSYRNDPENTVKKIKENIEFYFEEINIYELDESFKFSQNLLFNFKYKIGDKILDLNNEPKVIEFKSFLYEKEKKEWLKKCLDTGIPVWNEIPFKELGFQFETIL